MFSFLKETFDLATGQYKLEWINGKCHVNYAKGHKYIGGWKNGNHHGQFNVIHEDGKK